jgi:hypothetical protein
MIRTVTVGPGTQKLPTMASQNTVQPIRILLINPNSSKAMTHGMEQALEKMELPAVRQPQPR